MPKSKKIEKIKRKFTIQQHFMDGTQTTVEAPPNDDRYILKDKINEIIAHLNQQEK